MKKNEWGWFCRPSIIPKLQGFPYNSWNSSTSKIEYILKCFIFQKNVKYTKQNKRAAAAAAKSLQSCPTLCDPTDGSPPGSLPGILQTRTLEWVAISFSNAWKWKVKVKSVHGIFQARVLECGAKNSDYIALILVMFISRYLWENVLSLFHFPV